MVVRIGAVAIVRFLMFTLWEDYGRLMLRILTLISVRILKSGSQNSDFKVRIQSQNSEFEVRTPKKMNHMWPYSSSRTHASANTNALYLHRSALQKQAEVRDACTSFFLEVVSRFCLSEDQSPSGEVVELLFSLLISTHGPYTPPLNTHTPWLYQIKEQALNRRRLLPQGFL